MAMFSSREPFNDDPEPWHDPRPGTSLFRGDGPWGHAFYDPRPEYDRPQHNPTNPILTALRTPGTDIYDLLQSLDSKWARQFSLAEENHAREVMYRLIEFRREN